MSAPFWISLLDTDIRKLPPLVRRQRRKPTSTSGSPVQISPPQTSTSPNSLTDGQTSPFTSRNEDSSATSAPEFVDPPPLQAFRKKRKPYADYPPPIQAEPEAQRYWNEYDNPESEDEGYYIYLDPNESDKFPGQEFFEACIFKARKLFGLREKGDDASGLSTAESSDDESGDDSPINRLDGYGTFPTKDTGTAPNEGYFSSLFRTFRDPYRDAEALHTIRRQTELERRSLLSEIQVRQHKTEMTKLRFYTTCIAMAVVIDTILSSMTITSRKKEKGIVDSIVLFGTICNLLLCVIAMISMKTRRERLSWVHQGLVLLFVCGNVIVDVLLLKWVFNGL